MSKSDWVAFSTADFLVGTTELSNDEVGVYIRLLCLQHQRGSLPSDLAQLARLVPGVRKAWPAIASKFVACGEGQIRNERMARECEAAARRMASYKLGAKVANERRWGSSQRSSRPPSVRSPGERPAIAERSLSDTPSDRQANRQATAERVAERSPPDRIDRREEKNPPTLSGGRGVGGEGESTCGEAEQARPQLALVRTLHPTAEEALVRLIRVRGDEAGRADFAGAVETRIRQAAKRLGELGMDADQAHAQAEITLAVWRWESWSEELAAIVTEARTKGSPAGWAVWRLREIAASTDHVRAATA